MVARWACSGGQIRGIWTQPADAARARLAPGNAQGGGGRAGSDDLQTTSAKQAGEGSLSRSRCRRPGSHGRQHHPLDSKLP